MLAMNYGQGLDAFARLEEKSTGVISTYALNRDYHDVIKGKLKRLATWFAHDSQGRCESVCGYSPVDGKAAGRTGGPWLARQAYQSCVARIGISWFFLAAILTDVELPLSAPEQDHCGSCRACLDICPTNAFTGPHQIDARRCISYLTIEHKGEIPHEFRKAIGNRIYGCDDCLAICPWNKFAAQSREAKFAARTDLVAPSLVESAATR